MIAPTAAIGNILNHRPAVLLLPVHHHQGRLKPCRFKKAGVYALQSRVGKRAEVWAKVVAIRRGKLTQLTTAELKAATLTVKKASSVGATTVGGAPTAIEEFWVVTLQPSARAKRAAA